MHNAACCLLGCRVWGLGGLGFVKRYSLSRNGGLGLRVQNRILEGSSRTKALGVSRVLGSFGV